LIEKEIFSLQKMKQEQEKYKRVPSMKDKTKFSALIGAQVVKSYDKVINVQKEILKFLKNLCENHNTRMQRCISQQKHHTKKFDMVSLTVNYLHSLVSNISLSKRNYNNAMHCLISLAEYVQGPCFANQELIKDANFFQIAEQILKLKPQLIDDTQNKSRKELERTETRRQSTFDMFE